MNTLAKLAFASYNFLSIKATVTLDLNMSFKPFLKTHTTEYIKENWRSDRPQIIFKNLVSGRK